MSDTLWDDEEEETEEQDDEIIDVEATSSDSDDTTDDLPAPAEEGGIVQPVEDVEEVVKVYDQFEEIKSKLLQSADVQKIGDSNHITKSGWRKIATAFNLSVETTNIDKEVSDGIIRYTVTARATAPNGKTVTGTGMCASNESNHMEAFDSPDDPSEQDDVFKVDGKWRRLREPRAVNEHNIMATAETRAKNRAISDLVGGGEVSAEEMKSMILE